MKARLPPLASCMASYRHVNVDVAYMDMYACGRPLHPLHTPCAPLGLRAVHFGAETRASARYTDKISSHPTGTPSSRPHRCHASTVGRVGTAVRRLLLVDGLAVVRLRRLLVVDDRLVLLEHVGPRGLRFGVGV